MKDKIYWTYEDISIKNRKLLHKNVIVDSNKGKYYKPVYYYDSINTFDIETTTIKDAERPFAYMYIWQFCLDNDRVYMGRTWQDFRKFIKALKKKLRLSPSRRLIVYVHNLSYEFQFMKDFFEIYEVFQIGPHKFLSVLAEGIEFRCSYLLTNMNLDKLCKNTPTCTHNKLSGQTYNYTKIRTPFSIISEEELEYCYNDVKGLAECLEYRLNEDNLVTIPKTSTGFVRRDMRTAMAKNKNNYIIFKETALTPFLYRLNRLAFRGGDTHGNSLYTRQVIYDIKSRDIKSSYPASLLINTYPMGPFEEVDPVWYMSNFAELQKTTCALISVTYKDIEYAAPDNMPYIPASKCFELTDCTYDNGRVKKASFLSMALTDIDYKIIEGTYKYSEKIINKVFMADRGYLPAEFRDTVINYFRNKTILDGIKESKYEYSKAKAKLNATYGMCVTKLDRAKVEWVEGELVTEVKSMNEILKEYYDSKNSFLPYQWGVWCTAWSRLRLRAAIQILGPDIRYCDTDSVFYVGDHEKEFEEMNNRLRIQAFNHGAYAQNSKGELLYLGLFEPDKEFKAFKYLGAKKYIGILTSGEWYCTIAGVNKDYGAKYFSEHGFDAFEDGKVIPNSGHLCAYYNDDKKHWIEIQGQRFLTGSNIALVDQDYTIGLATDYRKLLEDIQNGIEHIF